MHETFLVVSPKLNRSFILLCRLEIPKRSEGVESGCCHVSFFASLVTSLEEVKTYPPSTLASSHRYPPCSR